MIEEKGREKFMTFGCIKEIKIIHSFSSLLFYSPKLDRRRSTGSPEPPEHLPFPLPYSI